MKRWKLTIEYDGRSYSGWQRQEEGIKTVQAAIESAIKGFSQQDITLHVAGRTDAGVHARGQVAHFDLNYGERGITGHDIMMAVNAHLKMSDSGVSIIHAENVNEDFHARFSARNKLYQYRIINRQGIPVLDRGLAWHVRHPLNVSAMIEAAGFLIGHHDFTTFRDRDCQAKSPMKTLDRLDIITLEYDFSGGVEIRFLVEGRSFLHHQVRNMVGTLELVGSGKWDPSAIQQALLMKDRTKGGPTAPPDGLTLMRVDY